MNRREFIGTSALAAVCGGCGTFNFGAKQYEDLRQVVGASVVLSAICSAVLLVAGWLLEFFDVMLLHELSEGSKAASFFF